MESHSRVHTVKLRPHIGRIGKGKASTEERERLRRQKISETMKKNPKAGGLREGSGFGKKEWYDSPIAGRVYLRSTYEKAFVRYLDRCKVRWKANTDGFPYKYEGKEHLYYPDFYLIDEQEYVEVKGFKRRNDSYKWKDFPFKLKVIFAEDLRKMGYTIDDHGNFIE